MDKKNTILLTVIAVATLLVAVVGATFAYYSVTATNSTTTTKYEVTSDAVGIVTLTSPKTDLVMNISAADMAQMNKDVPYYAVEKITDGVQANYASSRQNHEIAVATLDTNGGSATTAYTCTANLIVTLNIADGSMGKVLQSGDAKLYLAGATGKATLKDGDSDTAATSKELDLSTLLNGATGNTVTKTYKLEYKVNGNSDVNKVAKITADLEFTNLTGRDQVALAGKTLTVTLDIDKTEQNKFSCTIDK